MARVSVEALFIKHNIPPGQGGILRAAVTRGLRTQTRRLYDVGSGIQPHCQEEVL